MGHYQKINRDFGVTVLLTTHYMEEADMLCERIAIINKGKITAVGSPEDLKSRYGGDVIEIQFMVILILKFLKSTGPQP